MHINFGDTLSRGTGSFIKRVASYRVLPRYLTWSYALVFAQDIPYYSLNAVFPTWTNSGHEFTYTHPVGFGEWLWGWLPTCLSKIVSLNLSAWATALEEHPDTRFVQYFTNSIANVFRIGFDHSHHHQIHQGEHGISHEQPRTSRGISHHKFGQTEW